jgi:hypothetical protein
VGGLWLSSWGLNRSPHEIEPLAPQSTEKRADRTREDDWTHPHPRPVVRSSPLSLPLNAGHRSPTVRNSARLSVIGRATVQVRMRRSHACTCATTPRLDAPQAAPPRRPIRSRAAKPRPDTSGRHRPDAVSVRSLSHSTPHVGTMPCVRDLMMNNKHPASSHSLSPSPFAFQCDRTRRSARSQRPVTIFQ